MKFRFFFNSKDSRVKFCKDAKNIQKYDFFNSQKIYLKMKFCINSSWELGEKFYLSTREDWKTKKINKFDSDKVYSFPPNKLRDNRYNIPCDKLCLSFFFFFFFNISSLYRIKEYATGNMQFYLRNESITRIFFYIYIQPVNIIYNYDQNAFIYSPKMH